MRLFFLEGHHCFILFSLESMERKRIPCTILRHVYKSSVLWGEISKHNPFISLWRRAASDKRRKGRIILSNIDKVFFKGDLNLFSLHCTNVYFRRHWAVSNLSVCLLLLLFCLRCCWFGHSLCLYLFSLEEDYSQKDDNLLALLRRYSETLM